VERPKHYAEFFALTNVSNGKILESVTDSAKAPILADLCSNELKIKQMNRNKEGEKYVPSAESQDPPFTFDSQLFVNKTFTQLTE
jgi:hypothetical protein